MSWFSGALDKLKETSTPEPVECPRGWGLLTFTLSFEAFFPWVSFYRKCPVGGVNHCTECTYDFNPDRIEVLKSCLAEIEFLRDDHTLSEEEYRIRRHMIIDFARSGNKKPGEALHLAAWIVGLVGMVIGIAGTCLAMEVSQGFWGLAILGAVALAVGLALMIAARKTVDENDPWNESTYT